ncbi:MAG TPA: hypothetical protein VND94_19200 [Terriglobia bacterium]|nr:hypothetical protein [Terriglobia bacterium]
MRKLYLVAGLILMALLPACATTPPKPAMAPLGANGAFGYSDRAIVDDRTMVTYTGAYIPVNVSNPRNDSRLQTELDKTHDLAVWRAAQLGQQQGYAALKIDHEQRDSDIEIHETPVYNPYPNYGFGPCWRGCYAHPWWFNDGYYGTQRTARGRAVIRLTIFYERQFDPKESGALSIAALLSQMQVKWGTATY